MPDLIILTEHFYPSNGATAQLLTDLVDGLTLKGFSITVLTSTRLDHTDRFNTVRFNLPYISESSILGKAFKGLFFCLCSVLWLLRFSHKKQRLLVVSNPPFVVIVGLILRLVKHIRYYFLFQDIFPRSALLSGVLPAVGPAVAIWRALIQYSLRNSECVILLSKAMKHCCRTEFGHDYPIRIISNWSVVDPPQYPNPTINEFSKKHNPSGKFLVQYSGNFGRLHDMLTILEAARLLRTEHILFQFIGGGSKAIHIDAYKTEFNLSNVTVLPYQPRHMLEQTLSSADIGIVSLMPGAEGTVAPSKLLGILAMHRPVLLVANEKSSLADEIVTSNIGRVCSPGDPSKLASIILKLSRNQQIVDELSTNAYHYYYQTFRKELALSAYSELFCEEYIPLS